MRKDNLTTDEKLEELDRIDFVIQYRNLLKAGMFDEAYQILVDNDVINVDKEHELLDLFQQMRLYTDWFKFGLPYMDNKTRKKVLKGFKKILKQREKSTDNVADMEIV